MRCFHIAAPPGHRHQWKPNETVDRRGGYAGDLACSIWCQANQGSVITFRTATHRSGEGMHQKLRMSPHISQSGQARTHAVIQCVLDYKLSTKEKVPSTGYLRQNEDSMESEQVLDVPDWSQGPRSRANERWIKMIKQKTCKDIEGVSQQQISSRELSTHPYRLTEY